jgi:N-acetylglucosamine kinase-like BadF-type ATPase
MPLFLGMDAGGTKTAAVLLTETGEEIGRGMGGAGNIATNSDETLQSSVQDAFRTTCESAGLSPETVYLKGVCVGVAGYSVVPRRDPFLHILQDTLPAETYTLCPDYEIAWWGATEGTPGIIIIAGTGAVAYARDAEGNEAKADGYGFLLGDRGSGFNLGLYALRHALHTMQTDAVDRVTQTVQEHTNAHISAEILHWLYTDFSPARVATLAPKIGILAEQGDTSARVLVVEMARRLRHTVREVRYRLKLGREIPVYPIGGLWELGSFFRNEFQEPQWLGDGSVEVAPEDLAGGHFDLKQAKHDAAYGAALLAIQKSIPG